MRRLGISYNAFDGLELLEGSLDITKCVADYVSVVWQPVSNFGKKISDKDSDIVSDLRRRHPGVRFLAYMPTGHGGHVNELKKRNLGLELSRLNGCTHHMSMDVDEYYHASELVRAINEVVEGDFDSSACQMQTYWKDDTHCLEIPEEYYVPLLYKIDDRNFDLRSRWAVPVDPTRRMRPGKIKLFERDTIEMHHMSYVRSDIRSKLENSSASKNFTNRIDALVSAYENWIPGDPATFAGAEERVYRLREIESRFGIKKTMEKWKGWTR
jgi:hypothetical protein